ncbi:hypothetical protein [Halomonas sp. PA16-9]|uniref:hypothetical protein n=1 Tax=Halomonas sp. PA16-9 TaxID=2576841 RepID=UPI0018C67A45
MSKDSYGNRMHPEALKYVIGIHEKKSKEVLKDIYTNIISGVTKQSIAQLK